MVCYATKCVTSALFVKCCHMTAATSPIRDICRVPECDRRGRSSQLERGWQHVSGGTEKRALLTAFA